jgi:hypothetical protein
VVKNVSAPGHNFNTDHEKRLTREGVDGMDTAARNAGDSLLKPPGTFDDRVKKVECLPGP